MKTKNLFILAAFAVLLSACSQVFPPNLYSPKAMNELTTDLKKISENYIIERINVTEKEKLTSEFGYANVELRDKEGQLFEQMLYYGLGIPHNDPKPKRASSRRQEPHAVNVEDIIKQNDNIEKYVEAAKVIMNEELEGKYKFESVTNLEFKADKEGALQIRFCMNVTEKGNSTRREGGQMVTDYYELQFNVDKDGNVIYEDD